MPSKGSVRFKSGHLLPQTFVTGQSTVWTFVLVTGVEPSLWRSVRPGCRVDMSVPVSSPVRTRARI